jgi:hypothetical protein
MRSSRFAALVTGMILFAATPFVGRAWSETLYKIQPVVRSGDQVGDSPIKVNNLLEIGALNDKGQLLLDAQSTTGSWMLMRFADGKLTPIVTSGKDLPGGTRRNSIVGTVDPVSMNQLGSAVFAASDSTSTADGYVFGETFLWDAQAQKVSAVALKGMPAVQGWTFDKAGGWGPVINSSNEMALVAGFKEQPGRANLLFVGRDGQLLPVALYGQDLPGSGTLRDAWLPSINDRGEVAFVGRRDDRTDGAYLWEKGTISPLVLPGSDVAEGKIAAIRGVWINSQNRNALVYARIQDKNNQTVDGLYLWGEGKLTPVAVASQEMPGGGTFRSLQFAPLGTGSPTGVSFANGKGEHALLASLTGGISAAYLMGADGTLSLILKSGMMTDLGSITLVGGPGSPGVGLNSQGQVAVTVRIDGGPNTVVLLTPAAP